MELNELNEKLAQIQSQIENNLAEIKSSKGIFEYRKKVMDSKEGKIGSLMKEMGKLQKEQRAEYGKRVNEIRNWAQEKFDALDAEFKAREQKARYDAETIDVTLPAKKLKKGYLHPNTQVRTQIVDIFGSMGFQIYEGNEIETDYYNFTALNIPQDHPSRDMQDTFYLSPEFLLRTQTSAGQVHVMESQQPPIKIKIGRASCRERV